MPGHNTHNLPGLLQTPPPPPPLSNPGLVATPRKPNHVTTLKIMSRHQFCQTMSRHQKSCHNTQTANHVATPRTVSWPSFSLPYRFRVTTPTVGQDTIKAKPYRDINNCVATSNAWPMSRAHRNHVACSRSAARLAYVP